MLSNLRRLLHFLWERQPGHFAARAAPTQRASAQCQGMCVQSQPEVEFEPAFSETVRAKSRGKGEERLCCQSQGLQPAINGLGP